MGDLQSVEDALKVGAAEVKQTVNSDVVYARAAITGYESQVAQGASKYAIWAWAIAGAATLVVLMTWL